MAYLTTHMNLLLRPLATTFAIVLTASAAYAADAISLKQQWQTGKRYAQSMTMDQVTSIDLGQAKMDQKMNMAIDMSSTVTKHEDGKSKRVAIKYEKMVMNMDMNGQKTTIDSSKPAAAAGPMGNPFAAIAGKEIRLVLDADDKVTGFENFDELTQAAGGSGNPLTASFLNKDALSKTIQQSSLQALPTHPVKPGDAWPFTVDLPMPQVGTGQVKGTYTYKGTSQHDGVACAEIAVEGKINFDMASAPASGGEANPAAALGMKIKDGTMTGTVWFDNALGMSRDAEIHQNMTMSMNSPVKPGETMTLPMKQTITTKLTKVEDAK